MSFRNIVDLRGKPPRFLSNQKLPLRQPERRTPLRSRRRRIRLAIFFSVFATLALLIYAVHLLSYNEELLIDSVIIQDEKDVPADLVVEYITLLLDDGKFHFLSRRNIFVYPREVIEHDLAADFPRIKKASVHRPAPLSRTMIVTLEEREPFALWCARDEVCFEMDDTGYVFAEYHPSVSSPATSYRFAGDISVTSSPIGQRYVATKLPGVLLLLQLLKEAGFTANSVLFEEGDILVDLQSGLVVKTALEQDASVVVRNLQLVLTSESLEGNESQIEYIDMRFGNRVYYKLKGEEAAQSAL